MEEYIFNCYKKWIKDENGSIAKRLSRLSRTANVLVVSLFVVLAAIIIAFLLVFCGVIREYWLIYAFAAELIISVISYIYTSRYAIKHSGEALNDYHQYCNDLDTMLSERGIKSRQFLEEIISRYKAINNNTNKKMEQNHDRINQAMKILVIPISVAVLGELLKKQGDPQSVVALGMMLILGIIVLYVIAFWSIYMFNNVVIRERQSQYMQFVTDLQSIIDFEKCDSSIEAEL